MNYREVMIAACDAENRVASVAASLFGLAKQCKSVDEFLAGCEDAEGYIQSEQAGSNRWEPDKLPRCWIQAKSNIAAGMRAGLSPAQYKSEKAFRTAKVEHNKAKKEATKNERPDRDASGEPEPQGTKPLADIPMIPDDLREMVKYLKILPELSRAKVVKDLTKQAKQAHDTYLAGLEEGERRKAKAKVA